MRRREPGGGGGAGGGAGTAAWAAFAALLVAAIAAIASPSPAAAGKHRPGRRTSTPTPTPTTPPTPPVAEPQPSVPPAEQVAALLDGVTPSLQRCAAEAGVKVGAATVDIASQLRFDDAGAVTACSVQVRATNDGKALDAASVKACVVGVLRALRFPASDSPINDLTRTWSVRTEYAPPPPALAPAPPRDGGR